MNKMDKRLRLILSVVLSAGMLLGYAQSSHAILTAVSTNPDGTVLTNPGNGFPVWYQDTAGIALEQCPTTGFIGNQALQDPLCIPSGGPVAGFVDFDEAFWWTAVAAAPDQGGVTGALLVLALEAAFGTGDPVEGQQIVFGRIRIRADIAAAGTYTVTHPFGVKVYNVTTPGINAINDTIDIGGGGLDFVAVLGSSIGPFLTCVTPAPPLGYLGDFNVLCTVTGSPNLTNFFRISSGLVTLTETDQFNVSGKIFGGVLPLPVTVDRTTYKCTGANCTIEAFAHSTTAATLTVSGTGVTPTQMSDNGAGAFFAEIPVPQTVLPTPPLDEVNNRPLGLSILAQAAGFTDVTLVKPVQDMVEISKAEYNTLTGTIKVAATSTDPRAILTAVAGGTVVGQLVGGTANADLNGNALPSASAPPAQVTVVSNAGASVSKPMTLVSIAETLKVTISSYSTSQKRYRIRGTSNAPGATVTVTLANGANALATIGTAVVGSTGKWIVNISIPQGAPARGGAAKVNINSTGGAQKLNRVLELIP